MYFPHSVILVVVLAVCAPSVQAYTPEQIRQAIKQAGGPEPFIAAMANMAAKGFPRFIDGETEGMTVTPLEKTIHFAVRLVNKSRKDIPNMETFRTSVADKNGIAVCSGPVSSILILEHGATFKYSVYAQNRGYLFDYFFDRNTCQKYIDR